MRTEMNIAKAFHNPSIQGAAGAAKRERSFELSLPALVKGIDAIGKRFEEQTSTSSISAQEVSFRLNAPLLIGAKISLALEIPRTLILENSLRLHISGAVVYVRSEAGNQKNQLAIIRLDKGYKLAPSSFTLP